jgi:nitrogen PTS system EIIA component
MPSKTEALYFDICLHDLRGVDRAQVLQALAWTIGRAAQIDASSLSAQMLLAEQASGSGIGDGIAIPQLKAAPVMRPFLAIAKLGRAVDFAAADSRNVDLVCAVLSPPDEGPRHLQRLARVTRLLKAPEIAAALRSCESGEEMAGILMDVVDTPRRAA